MKITLVKSSNIVAVGRGRTLVNGGVRGEAVWMYFGNDGVVDSVYSYPYASANAIDAMLVAPSVGSYWAQYVKEEQPYFTRLEGPELKDALAELEMEIARAETAGPDLRPLIDAVFSALRAGCLVGDSRIGPHVGFIYAIQCITNAASAWSMSATDTAAEELAGAVVRILRTAESYGIDIETALTAMAGEQVGK